MISKKQPLDRFRKAIKRLKKTHPQLFASALGEILDDLEDSKVTKSINARIAAQKDKDTALLRSRETDLLATLRLQNKEIEAYYEKHSTVMPCGHLGEEGVSEFHAYEQGKIVSSHGLIDCLIQANINALSYLMEMENTKLKPEIRNFVQQHAFINDDGQVIDLKILHQILLWREEKRRIERIQVGTPWFAWQELKRFHAVYKNYERDRRQAVESGDLFLDWQLCDDIKRIEGIATGKQPQYMMDLKYHLQRLAREMRQNHATKANGPSNNVTSSFDGQKGILTINNIAVTFKGKRRRAMISLFFKNGKPQRKQISLEQIHAKEHKTNIEEYFLEKEDKDAIYEARDGVNLRIKEEAGITEYLTLKQSKIGINPTYLS